MEHQFMLDDNMALFVVVEDNKEQGWNNQETRTQQFTYMQYRLYYTLNQFQVMLSAHEVQDFLTDLLDFLHDSLNSGEFSAISTPNPHSLVSTTKLCITGRAGPQAWPCKNREPCGRILECQNLKKVSLRSVALEETTE
uniref:Uncharacterized protein n=1 Tax=Romanomermis culicivorax TaxID=13658 RepID=A0A915INV5_ROMCU